VYLSGSKTFDICDFPIKFKKLFSNVSYQFEREVEV